MTEMFSGPETQPLPGSTLPVSAPEATASGSEQSTKETAKEQARDVAQEGVQAGKHVASVATGQAKEVASEAGQQAKALFAEAKSELLSTASSQQQRVAEQLHELSKQLGSMASKSEHEGLATSLTKQASRQVGTVAHWVSEREPGSLVDELKEFGRNKPGAFLAVAAGIGLLAGRMTRGVKAGAPAPESGPAMPGAYPTQQGIPAPEWAPPSAPPSAPAAVPPGPLADRPAPVVGPYAGDLELTESFPARPTGIAP